MKDWNKYYVTNDQVIDILKEFSVSSAEDKIKIENNLVGQLNYLVQSKIKGYRNKTFYNDLLQEGKIGLLKAINDFDLNRGPNFFKFACWHIQHRIKLYLCWQKRSSITLEQVDEVTEINDNVENCERKIIIKKILNKLPEIDRKVLLMRFGIEQDSLTFKQVGEKLKISKQRVEQIQKRALLKLKNNKEIKQLR